MTDRSSVAARTELLEVARRVHEANGPAAFPKYQLPVGFVFLSVLNTNPADQLGYGTWVRIAEGMFLVGQKATDADFDTAEETGGEKTHVLTVAEMPNHTHVQDPHTHIQDPHNHLQDAHAHGQSVVNSANDGTAGTRGSSDASDTTDGNTANATATNQAATATNQNATATNQATGGGAAHNNVPPYFVVYMWKRTA